jgi:hypothetical protein
MKNRRAIIASVTPRSSYYMAGTEQTGEYVTVAKTELGSVGIREFAPDQFRIRVEPSAAGKDVLGTALTRASGWKQPGDSKQERFSICSVGHKSDDTVVKVRKALHAIVSGGNIPVAVNSRAPAFARNMVSHAGLVAAVQEAKVAGANLASNWSLHTLCSKVGA